MRSPKKVDRARLAGRGAEAGALAVWGEDTRRGRSRARPIRGVAGSPWDDHRDGPTSTCATARPQAFDPVGPGLRRGAGERRQELRQRSAPPLALKGQLAEILASPPPPPPPRSPGTQENRAEWKSRQEGLSVKVTLPEELPPLRMLCWFWTISPGTKRPSLCCGMFARGIMVLYTPLGGSWLNMTESIQRILARRALEGRHPRKPEEIIEWLEATARGWNRDPTPFSSGGVAERRAGLGLEIGGMPWEVAEPVREGQYEG